MTEEIMASGEGGWQGRVRLPAGCGGVVDVVAGGAGGAVRRGASANMLAALRKHDGSDEARRCAGYVETNRARTR